jgi:hypothetical protein
LRPIVACTLMSAIAVVAGACGGPSGDTTGAQHGSVGKQVKPPCTAAAIRDAARKTYEKFGGTVKDIQSFRCTGRFAYALVDMKGISCSSGCINSVTLLLITHGGRWVSVNPEPYCLNRDMPRNIYVKACGVQ